MNTQPNPTPALSQQLPARHETPIGRTEPVETPMLYGFIPVVLRLTGRQLASGWNIIFTFGIPITMYLIFGIGQDYSSIEVGHGNVAANVLINMSQYAAIIVTSMATASIAVERTKGWVRSMSLTPLGARGYLWAKVLTATLLAFCATGAVYAVGVGTGVARMEGSVWVQTLLLIITTSAISSLLGLVAGLAVGNENGYGFLGGAIALLGFLSGLFIPLDQLSEFFQTVARFTPLWGINQLAITPLIGWENFTWKPAANIIGWLVILSLSMLLLSRRANTR